MQIKTNFYFIYRHDADITRPYGKIVETNTNYTLPSLFSIQKRPKKIAWFSSHCTTPNMRESLAQRINRSISTDVYGKCGHLKCSRGSQRECYKMMEENYKFYLSFENSLCQDYVTEKLFKILSLNVVPVVYGAVNYDVIAPPYSVIDVSKFKTVKNLVNYLKFLDENPKEYLKYFEWKKSYVNNFSQEPALCKLCQKLNEPQRTHFYEDILHWLNPPGMCKSEKELPAIVFS